MDEQKPKSREEILAAIRAKAEAIRAQRDAAKGTGPGETQAPEAAPTVETFVSSLNAAGRPTAAAQNLKLRVYGSVNFSVEITCESTEEENLRKLLGGIGAYQNPLRRDAFQVDYRYYGEAKRRLERAGYQIEENSFGVAPEAWTPQRGGWTKIE